MSEEKENVVNFPGYRIDNDDRDLLEKVTEAREQLADGNDPHPEIESPIMWLFARYSENAMEVMSLSITLGQLSEWFNENGHALMENNIDLPSCVMHRPSNSVN